MRWMRKMAIATAAVAGIIATPILSYAGYLQLVGNIHAVEDGKLYRSATLGTWTLEQLIGETGVRTIVNLRGGEGSDWYENERRIAAAHGIDFVRIHISANHVPGRQTLDEIAFILKTAPQPILVHCKAGADRAGLASAIYEYTIARKPLPAARSQLSFFYGHFPWLGSTTGAMDRALTLFAEGFEPE